MSGNIEERLDTAIRNVKDIKKQIERLQELRIQDRNKRYACERKRERGRRQERKREHIEKYDAIFPKEEEEKEKEDVINNMEDLQHLLEKISRLHKRMRKKDEHIGNNFSKRKKQFNRHSSKKWNDIVQGAGVTFL